MNMLTNRVDALERTCGAVSHAEITKAMHMLEARALAKLDGATELPPEPPAHVLAEIERRYCTPENMDVARAKLAKLLASRDRPPQHGTENADPSVMH